MFDGVMARKRKAPNDAKKDPKNDTKKPRTEGHTIYLQNLSTSLPIADLRTALYLLCSLYGRVTALNAHKSPRMRGQAHVAFDSPEHASTALHELQDRDFLGKPIRCAWARAEAVRSEWRTKNVES